MKHLFLILFAILITFIATDLPTDTDAKAPTTTSDELIHIKESSTKPLEKFDNLQHKIPKNKEELKSEKTFIANISAYTASADECGKSDGITASGKLVKANHTIACPKNYKFGTKVKVEGYGIYTCEDRGGAIKGNKFDIYMISKKEAFTFGRRQLKVYILS